MNNSHDDETPQKPRDEIAVTEVSDEVLRELSDLFGPTKGTPRPPEPVVPTDPTPLGDITANTDTISQFLL